MTFSVVPDNFALMQRLSAIERAIEETYRERLERATRQECKKLGKQMRKEIDQAIKTEIQNTPWTARGHSGPWIR